MKKNNEIKNNSPLNIQMSVSYSLCSRIQKREMES